MKASLTLGTLGTALVVVATSANIASARPAATDDSDDAVSAPRLPTEKTEDSSFGVGVRVRDFFQTPSVVQGVGAVASMPSTLNQYGASVELARRWDNFEMQLGLGYDGLNMDPGIWERANEHPSTNGVDYATFHHFGAYTAELNFLGYVPITSFLSLRAGGGVGVAVITGNVTHVNVTCSSDLLSSCGTSAPTSPNDKKYDVWPAYPMLNGIIGLQFRPSGNMYINIDGGLRTAFFDFGVAFGMYL